MKRNLLTQMKKEWRDNIWLLIELAIVGLAIWILIVFMYAQCEGLFYPRGFNPDNVFSLSMKTVPKKSPNWQEQEKGADAYYADFAELMKRLRSNPNVESVAYHNGVLPYNYNYNGSSLNVFESDDSIEYFGNVRSASPDIVNVLELNSLTGKSRKQLVEMLKNGELLIGGLNKQYTETGRDPKDLIGKKVIIGGDSSKIYRVGDVVETIRRTDYEMGWGGGILRPLSDESKQWGQIVLRVKPGRELQFKEDFKTNEDLRKQRNIYLSDLKSLMDIRKAIQNSSDVNIRMYIVLMFFLLVTIFLGLLGSFWFRMQQRISEIAIRKVCGAKRSEIFSRVITEGMILLSGALLVVSAFIWPFINTFENMLGMSWYTFLITEFIAFFLIGIGIVISLWYPARQAMNIEPAIAIKTE